AAGGVDAYAAVREGGRPTEREVLADRGPDLGVASRLTWPRQGGVTGSATESAPDRSPFDQETEQAPRRRGASPWGPLLPGPCSEVHVAAAGRTRRGLLLLGLVRHHSLGGEEQRRDRSGVLQRGTRHLGRDE